MNGFLPPLWQGTNPQLVFSLFIREFNTSRFKIPSQRKQLKGLAAPQECQGNKLTLLLNSLIKQPRKSLGKGQTLFFLWRKHKDGSEHTLWATQPSGRNHCTCKYKHICDYHLQLIGLMPPRGLLRIRRANKADTAKRSWEIIMPLSALHFPFLCLSFEMEWFILFIPSINIH